MDNPDFHRFLDLGTLGVNIFLGFVMLKVKLEIQEIKVWILENFERRKDER
jgi:hypothetical protein